MKKIRGTIAVALILCMIITASPIGFIGETAEFFQAWAEEQQPVEMGNPSGSVTSSEGWIYRIVSDDRIELLGHSDALAKELSIPERIDSRWVVGIGENAFEGNPDLECIFIPTCVAQIHETAFPASEKLRVQGWNGSAGLAFASAHGLVLENRSNYDFFDQIIDLSGLKSSQWGLSGSTLRISEPFDAQIEVGSELFIPPCERFVKGMPVSILSAEKQEGYSLFCYTNLDFASSVESYHEEDVRLVPDLSRVRILEDGFTLRSSGSTYARSINSFEINPSLEFEVSCDIGEDSSLDGTIKWTPSILATVDYSDFKINELSYTNTTTTVFSVGVGNDQSEKLAAPSRDDKTIDFAEVPLVSVGLVTAYARLSIVINVEGSAELEVTLLSTEYVNFRPDTGLKRDKSMRMADVDLSAKIEIGLSMELALAICVGFTSTDFKLDIAEFAISYGFKLEVEATLSTEYSYDDSTSDTIVCLDVSPKIVFKGSFKIGVYLDLPGAGSISKGREFTLFEVEKPVGRFFHIESDKGLVDKCTRGALRVRFYSGSGTTVPDQIVRNGDKLTKPTDPVREGYSFAGWYKEKELQSKWNFSSDVVTESIILYAGWVNPVGELIYIEDDDININSLYYLDYTSTDRLVDIENDSYIETGLIIAITGAKNSPKNLIIPSVIDGLKVVSLGTVSEGLGGSMGKWLFHPAFRNCTSIESVILPDSIDCIVEYNFSGCTNLKSIQLSKSITSIEKGSFENCRSLKEITIPEGVTRIADYAFANCSSLESIYLPSTLQSIGAHAFEGCSSLKLIGLPTGLKSIGNYAFAKCTALAGVALPVNLETLGSYAFSGCTSLASAKLTVSLGDYCFRDCTSLTYLTFTDNVSAIGNYAFYNCDSLTQVEIPQSVTAIGRYAFYDCDQLACVSTWANPGDHAFRSCDLLEEVILYDGVTSIGYSAFRDCKNLVQIELPPSLETIDGSAFSYCALYGVAIPHRVKSIGDEAFAYNSHDDGDFSYGFSELTIGDNVETVSSNIIYGADSSELRIYTVPDCAADIAFRNSSYKDCIEYISENSHRLTLVLSGGYMPNPYSRYVEAGEYLELWDQPVRMDYSFEGWYRDEACTQPWELENDVMPDSDLTLYAAWTYLPEGLIYRLDTNGHFGDKGIIITGYTGSRSQLDIPESINGIPVRGIFANAIPAGVTRVNLPSSILSLTERAFVRAADLMEITVTDGKANGIHATDGVLYIENSLFAYPRAKAMECFIPEAGTTDISFYAFYGTSALQSVVLPESVQSFGYYAFANSTALKSVVLPEGITVLHNYLFYNCPVLEQLELPSSLMEIQDNAIASCRSLTEVTFKGDARIGKGNFSFCGGNDGLYIYGPLNAPELTAYADTNGLNYNEYSVQYILDGEMVAVVMERAGTTLAVPPAPSEDERTFAGWSLEENGATWNFENDLMPERSIVLHALMKYDFSWSEIEGGVRLLKYTGKEKQVRVPETIDGMPVLDIADDCFSGTPVVKLIGRNDSLTDKFATRNGYAFDTIKYTITYRANGGYFPVDNSDVFTEFSDGGAWGIPTVRRTGYAFDGWYLDQACTERWDEIFPYADLTVYAGWSKADAEMEDLPFAYRTHKGSVYIIGYTGNKTTVVIPASINNMPVVGIDDYAFFGNQVMFDVTIPSSVKSVGRSAFCGSRVAVVQLSSGLETIGARAFADCTELSKISLPSSLREVGAYAFANCTSLTGSIGLRMPIVSEGMFSGCAYLKEIVLYESVQKVCDMAFADCSAVEEFYILGDSLSEISPSAFDGCSGLSKFSVLTSPYFKAIDGALYTKDGTCLIRVGEGKKAERFVLPEEVRCIAAGAMKNTGIRTLVLNEKLISIEADALRGSTALEQIEFAPNGQLEIIGRNAFSGCWNLTRLDLPKSLVALESKAFSNCKLREVHVGKNTYLGENCIPFNLNLTIYGFAGSSAEDYSGNKGIRFIDLTRDIPVEGIEIPSDVMMKVGQRLTIWSRLLPAYTTEKTIRWVSDDPSVVSVNASGELFALRSGETVVRATAQNGQEAECWVMVMKEDGLPTGIETETTMLYLSVGETRAFRVSAIAANPNYAYVDDAVVDWDIAHFNNNSYEGEASEVFGAKPGRTQIIFTTCNGLQMICDIVVVSTFTDSPELVLPKGLQMIGDEAFMQSSFSSVRCSEGMTEIGASAFLGNENLKQIFIPDTVQRIGKNAFLGCNQLIIYGASQSYAQEYAQTNGIPFIICTSPGKGD